MTSRAAELRAWLAARVAREAGVAASHVDPDASFAAHGLESPQLVAIARDLEEVTGAPVEPSVLFEHPTIAALAAHLASQPASAAGDGGGAGGDAIAIVGIGCRMPGAEGPDAFWRLLDRGVDAVGEAPAGRWDPATAADPRLGGPMPWTRGGFLPDVRGFDAAFFGISAEEARRMDPQQRLLLETCWDALEDAGEVPERLRGTRTGVYVGVSVSEYLVRQLRGARTMAAHTLTGSALSVAANRVSYVLGLEGPSLAVDTACSSSLVATHLAVQALRRGECDRAVVAGVNVLLDPEMTIGLGLAGMLAPDGRCKTFDASANGYVRGEGAGVVVLKPLAAAQAAADRVYAVVRGTAVNQDGRSNGLTAPNPAAQRAVMRAAYRDAGVDPHAVRYVECHGTGTFLGDPIEAGSVGAVVGGPGRRGEPCLIGSVKSNIGHLESAAGVAGLIKVALALDRGQIPPSLHFSDPNPQIPFDDLALRVVTQTTPWPDGPGPPLAGVSSFGFGGTNAHAVLEASPAPVAAAPAAPMRTVLPVSARSEAALERSLTAWAARLAEAGSDEEIAALTLAAATRRTHHRPFRRAILARSPASLGERVAQAASEPPRPSRHAPPRAAAPPRGAASAAPRASTPRIGFVFCGQGAHWPGMARDLLRDDALFASTIRRCDEILAADLGWSIAAVLAGDDERSLDDTAVAQPVLVAMQVALAAAWRALGVEPAAVAGHSIGDVSAAVVAGAIDLESGLRLAARRGRAMAGPEGAGGMLAVGLDRDEAERVAARHDGAVELAAVNGPRATVLSGDPAALDAIRAEIVAGGGFARPVATPYAFHSRRMEGAAERLAAELGDLRIGSPELPWHSTVLGRPVGEGEADAEYWARGVRQPVELDAAARAMIDVGVDALLEVGPHPALRAPLRQVAAAAGRDDLPLLRSLERGAGGRDALLDGLAAAYELGAPVRWSALHPGPVRQVSLPPHPWERREHWLERPAADGDSARGTPTGHTLLGTRLDLAVGTPIDTSLRRAQRDPAGGTPSGANGGFAGGMPSGGDGNPDGGEPGADGDFGGGPPSGANGDLADGTASGTRGEPAFAGRLTVWESTVDADALPALRDHRVGGATLLPASAFAEVAVAAARDAGLGREVVVEGLEIARPLALDGGPVVLQTALADGGALTVHARPAAGREPWTLHARARVVAAGKGPPARPDLAAATSRCTEPLAADAFYAALAAQGLDYGPAFRVVRSLWRADGEAVADLDVAADGATGAVRAADGALQTVGAALGIGPDAASQAPVPVGVAAIRATGDVAAAVRAHAVVRSTDPDRIVADVTLADADGAAVLELSGVEVRRRLAGLRSGEGPDPSSEVGLGSGASSDPSPEVGTGSDPSPDAASPEGGGGLHLYEARWRERSLHGPDAPSGRWLVLAEGDGRVGDALLSILGGRGVSCARDQPWEPVLASLLDDPVEPLAGVADLRGLDRSADPTDARDATLRAIALVRALSLAGGRAMPRLVVATRGCQPVPDGVGVVDPLPAAVWGALKTAPVEIPLLNATCVDLDPNDDDDATRLHAEIAAATPDAEVAYRDGRRYVRRLTTATAAASCPRAGQPGAIAVADATYVLTGGTGGLGLELAAWLVQRGARHLALLARDPGRRSERVADSVRMLESAGAQVQLLAVDVADEHATARALAGIRKNGPPIRGVVHAAGVLADGPLLDLKPEAVDAVLKPKIAGARNLDELTRDDPLDWFVLFSSAAAILGSPGQANYAAGNAYLDALAHHRRQRGLPALAIDWGPWAEVGMAAESDTARRLRTGVSAIAPDAGLATLERLLTEQDRTQALVLPFDLRHLLQFYPAQSTDFFEEIARDDLRTLRSSIDTSSSARPELSAEYVAPRTPVEQRIAGAWQRALGVEPVGAFDSFFELGGDSVFANQLVLEINRLLGVAIEPERAFEDFTVAHLAALAEEAAVAQIERLSDDQAERLVRQGE